MFPSTLFSNTPQSGTTASVETFQCMSITLAGALQLCLTAVSGANRYHKLDHGDVTKHTPSEPSMLVRAVTLLACDSEVPSSNLSRIIG
jgi:hypothetical protein